MARDILLTYPYLNETLRFISILARFQLGAVISQKFKTIHFYCRKMIHAKQWYTATERELLSTVETLKDYIAILICHILRIFTDHKLLPVKFSIPIEY